MPRKEIFHSDDYGYEPYGGACYYSSSRYDWVNSHSTRTPEESPYGYSEYYIFRKGDLSKCSAVYSDRMVQWKRDIYFELWKTHVGDYRWDKAPRENLVAFCRAYFDNPELELCALAQGCNVSSGYPYWIIWYK